MLRILREKPKWLGRRIFWLVAIATGFAAQLAISGFIVSWLARGNDWNLIAARLLVGEAATALPSLTCIYICIYTSGDPAHIHGHSYVGRVAEAALVSKALDIYMPRRCVCILVEVTSVPLRVICCTAEQSRTSRRLQLSVPLKTSNKRNTCAVILSIVELNVHGSLSRFAVHMNTSEHI